MAAFRRVRDQIRLLVDDYLCQAEADGFIPSDAKVKVMRVTGLTLKVTKADERIIVKTSTPR